GSDNIAAAPGGDLAVRLYGHRDVLVLNAAEGYASSRWVQPPDPDATITALGYDNVDLLLGLHNGDIWRVGTDWQADNSNRARRRSAGIDRDERRRRPRAHRRVCLGAMANAE